MTEDKLTAQQRIRLEAVNQANGRLGPRLNGSGENAITELLSAAKRIAAYIEGAGEPDAS